MVRETFVALIAWAALGCGIPQHALYPGWEPTSPIVPEVRNRSRALAALEASYQRWVELGYDRAGSERPEAALFGGKRRGYTYVRARQASDAEVEFTLLVVENGSVVERALLSTRPDASGLGDHLRDKHGSAPELRFHERLSEVGRHPGGAPPLSIDQLYRLCREQVLGAHPELQPRLSFRRDGLLQHCGFLVDDCPGCPAASLVSVARIRPLPWQKPSDLVCNDAPGLVVAGDAPVFGVRCQICDCFARNSGDPNAARSPAPEGGLGDICSIDPRACPEPEPKPPKIGRWVCKWLLSADCMHPGGALDTQPACSGRPAELDSEWQRRCRRSR